MLKQASDMKVFAGNSNLPLARQIASSLGLELGGATVGRFSDGEISISINETVRGVDVFLIQSTCAPVNDHLMEMLIMIDAFRRASAGRITAVMPYFGYARQDRKAKSRDPISAKLVADMIVCAGADRVLTMDLHTTQLQGFFNIPVDNLLGTSVLLPYFADLFGMSSDSVVVVAPDHGSIGRARRFTERLDLPLAIVDKRRQRANVSEVMNIIGEVSGKTVLLVDDMIDTAGTLCNAASALITVGGAAEVYACATHGVLSGVALERIEASVIKKVFLLDTIPIEGDKLIDKIKVLSVSSMFTEAIKRIHEEVSVSDLFN